MAAGLYRSNILNSPQPKDKLTSLDGAVVVHHCFQRSMSSILSYSDNVVAGDFGVTALLVTAFPCLIDGLAEARGRSITSRPLLGNVSALPPLLHRHAVPPASLSLCCLLLSFSPLSPHICLPVSISPLLISNRPLFWLLIPTFPSQSPSSHCRSRALSPLTQPLLTCL